MSRESDAARFGAGRMPVSMGPINATARDRFGTPIVAGAHVLYRSEMDLVFEVVEAKPVLDPRAPTGTVQLVLKTQVPIAVVGGQPLWRFITLGTRPAEGEPDVPPPDEPVVVP